MQKPSCSLRDKTFFILAFYLKRGSIADGLRHMRKPMQLHLRLPGKK